MSSSVGDPNERENDCEVNYIADYMTEVEDDGAPESDVDVVAPGVIQPYQDEPIADEEWVAKYHEERREQETKLEMLKGRLEGHISVESW